MPSCRNMRCRARRASRSCASPRRCCAFPDADTADRLIRDKIGGAQWDRHRAKSESVFVNASTWALMLTGRIVKLDDAAKWDFEGILKRAGRALRRTGHPPGRDLRDARPRPPVRARPHDRARRSRKQNRSPRTATASPSTCWARPPTPRPMRRVTRQSYRDALEVLARQHSGRRARHLRTAEHLGEAFRASSALRMGEARARLRRTDAGAGRARRVVRAPPTSR